MRMCVTRVSRVFRVLLRDALPEDMPVTRTLIWDMIVVRLDCTFVGVCRRDCLD